MKYERILRLNSHDIDPRGALRPTAVLREMQETANEATEADGPSLEELRKSGYAFIVSRMTVSVYADIGKKDGLRAETWATDLGGAFSCGRCYRIKDEKRVLAEGMAIFALVDINARRPVRADTVKTNYRSDAPLELDMPMRLSLPPDSAFSLVGERAVRYSETDINGHMNNTRYADMFCDFLPSPENKRILGLSFAYANEAKCGETLKIYRADGGDGIFCFRSLKKDGKVNAESEIITEER